MEELLAQQGWLKRLAQGMVRDAASAEDLVQGTFVAALDRQSTVVRSPKAWLGRVARNLSNSQVTSDVARSNREQRVARNETLGSTADLVASTEMHRLLAEQVMQLAEPYRSTLVLHYFEGMSLVQIGSRAGVCPSTIRTRLSRGLEQLRRSMDAKGGGREKWMSVLAPIALAEQGARVGTLALVVIGALLVVGGGFALWPPQGVQGPQSGVQPSVALGDLEFDPQPDVVLASSSSGMRAANEAGTVSKQTPTVQTPIDTKEVLADLPRNTIEIQVLRDDEPASGARVLLSEQAGYYLQPELIPGKALGLHKTLNAQGIASFPNIEPGDWALSISLEQGHLRQVVVRLGEEKGKRAVVRLGSASARGHAYDRFGAPVAGAVITWSHRMKSDHGFWSVAVTQADGSYQLDHLLPGPAYLSRDIHDHGATDENDDMTRVTIQEGEPLVWNFGSPSGQRRVQCQIRTSGGEPVRGGFTLSLVREQPRVFRQVYLKDGDEGIVLLLEPGTWSIEVDLPYPPFSKRYSMTTIEVGDLDLDEVLILPGHRVAGTLAFVGDAPPLKRCNVSLRPLDGDYFYKSATWIDETTWVLDGVQPGEWDIWGSARNSKLRDIQSIEVIDGPLHLDLVAE